MILATSIELLSVIGKIVQTHLSMGKSPPLEWAPLELIKLIALGFRVLHQVQMVHTQLHFQEDMMMM